MKLTLYFREYCSLCHQMLAELAPWRQRYGFELEVLDVDADPALEARFNELVPVLMDGEAEICHWHLDAARLAAHLGEIG
ncbi:glutaredoxin family protein [Chromobacterium subtsugae]|uniref:Glutaredoxin family protein n=1 Tax=Chromobacterium subtsugae TaxID=251747 RepID=A0ABS7FF04_9NEIS|nr:MULTISPECIES: glutaredoxin family protein [Chromobacterium]KUM03471.1 glutaredoxin [Chromobacterium subtsugae]KZE87609.1 glutaredoxin [Chromobacterium sp. F49]MBW7567018.1 glutaredoxin family protein [Chromobacterium subtsugae]MBW8288663.1 glutaredoxin family protein [Chromobacterium subtsugae]OBU85800.1 glutaredoxin [Chromobacterium subtsugae]